MARTSTNDLVTGVKYVQELESEKRGEKVEVVLVGYSSGGGLSQLILSEGDVKAKAFASISLVAQYSIRRKLGCQLFPCPRSESA